MEIQELVSYYLFEDTGKIEVSFRLDIDSDDELRTDTISLDEANDFGYNFIDDDEDFIDDDEENDLYNVSFKSIDEYQLLNFLNEYYVINLDQLPKSEFI